MGKPILKLIFFIIFAQHSAIFCASQGTFLSKTSIPNAHKTVFKILNGDNYSKDVRPFPASPDGKYGNATVIKVNMFIRSIDRIDDLRMEISTQMTFRQYWTDSRLEYPTNETEYVTLNEAMADKIWTPHLFFTSEATSFVHNTMKTNSFKRVYQDGRVVWSTRITLVFSCPMDFRFFPFESQICALPISEYSHSNKEIAVIWHENQPVELRERGKLRYSRFNLQGIKTGSCVAGSVAGQFSCIFVNFYLQRQSTAYILTLYIPSTMCVMLSWVSFWLGPSISARLSLTLTVLLTMTTQVQGSNQNLPQVSYTKALDIWTGFCTTIGALAILQTATVAFVLQRDKKVELESVFVYAKNEKNQKFIGYNSFARRIDIVCRIAFPVTFLGFVVVYVLVYYVIGQNSPSDDYPFE